MSPQPADGRQGGLFTESDDGAPLATRMRPKVLEDFIGQEHLLGPDRPLAQLAQRKRIHSMIFWGPPGVGKTTLAKLLADAADVHWISLSAVLAGIRDVRAAIDEARAVNRKTVLFIDEVHRFNKAQQDAFLPHVEAGTVTFIGATTENPSFEVNAALLSRSRVYVLKPLGEEHLVALLARARGAAYPDLMIDDAAVRALVAVADGDARRALNTLEMAAQLVTETIAETDVEAASGQTYRRFDKGGDAFYDQISALQKSVRGSSPDGALYWLARLLDGGCDPLYVARRLMRMASEDVGNADPRALSVAIDAAEAYHRLGSPEGELALAQAVVYLASVPKSNAVLEAFGGAMQFVKEHPSWPVPNRFRNAPTSLMAAMGHGDGYRYAHAEEDSYAAGERYFPDEMHDEVFYRPKPAGLEAKIAERLDRLRGLDREARHDAGLSDESTQPENRTDSREDAEE